MKKLVTLLLALALGFGLKAQCPLNQAVDFTATDCHGTEVHLFDILDGGQYVLIDFADDFIYKELEQHLESRTVPAIPLLRDEAIRTFRAWEAKQDKVEY